MVEPEITGEGLKFIRDEILKLMVTSIAEAKAETLGAFEVSNQVTRRNLATLNAGSNHGAVCLACAITVALAESGAIDPNHVIRWAEWMASNQPPSSEPAISEAASRYAAQFLEDHDGAYFGAAGGVCGAELRGGGRGSQVIHLRRGSNVIPMRRASSPSRFDVPCSPLERQAEITSRMIDAGIDAWIDLQGGDDCRALVCAIYQAMRRQSPEPTD